MKKTRIIRCTQAKLKEVTPGLHEKIVFDKTLTEELIIILVVLDTGAKTEVHIHKGEEAFYILEGEGRGIVGDKEYSLKPDSCLYIPANTTHQVINIGDKPLRFLAFLSNF